MRRRASSPLAFDGMGVHAQQHSNAVPGPLRDLCGWHSGREPGGDACVPHVVPDSCLACCGWSGLRLWMIRGGGVGERADGRVLLAADQDDDFLYGP